MKIFTEIPTIPKGAMASIDIEMFGQDKDKLHRPHGEFACISIAVEGREDVYQLYDTHDLKKLFASLKSSVLVGHNMLYDLKQLSPRFVQIKPQFVWDTMLVEQSMFGGYYQHFSLKDLVRRWLGVVMNKEIRAEFAEATEMSPEMKRYAAEDALLTLQVAMKQRDEFVGSPAFNAYKTIDEPMIWPVLDMPGVPIDVKAWQSAVTKFKETSDIIQDELGFNVFSQAQVLGALKKARLNLNDTKATTLAAYVNNSPLVEKIIEARMYRKAASTYGEKWLEKYVEADGKAYPGWNIIGAETGRMSSKSPNGQNIPQRKLPIYRTFFVASPNHRFIVDDVSQQEPCILADRSQDRTLMEAIKKGEDLHLRVAREIFNDPKMQKDDSRRAIGKMINLGTSYGLSEHGLSTRLNIPLEEAQSFLNQYFSRFTGVFTWISQMRQSAFALGYITTTSGRRVYINPYDNQWQNNAINAPIQGGAADFTKMWVRKYWEKCNKMGLTYSLCLIVHDELGLNTPKEEVKATNKARKEAFDETAQTLFPSVPFKSEAEMGRSWACKSIKEELIEEDEDDL